MPREAVRAVAQEWWVALRKPMDQVECLIYVLVSGAIALVMDMLGTPWWCYIPPVALLTYAVTARYLAARQVPGKHRK